MSISCGTGHDDYEWYYDFDDDFSITDKNRKCFDCNKKIKFGEYFLNGWQWRYNENGEEIGHHKICLCEKCAEIFCNLSDLGYIISLGARGEKTLQEDLETYKSISRKTNENNKDFIKKI